jgi:hypothetical protein
MLVSKIQDSVAQRGTESLSVLGFGSRISFQRGASIFLRRICHAPNLPDGRQARTLTSPIRTGGTAKHHMSDYRRGCPRPNCKADRRDARDGKVMRSFEKKSGNWTQKIKKSAYPIHLLNAQVNKKRANVRFFLERYIGLSYIAVSSELLISCTLW